MNGDIPRSEIIDQKAINQHELCYQFSKQGPERLFGKLNISYIKYEPYFPAIVLNFMGIKN